ETQTPLARTVIGGLLFSSFLTLFLIPVIFAGLEERRRRLRKDRAGIALVLILIIGLVAGVSTPTQAAEAQKITVAEAVAMAMENSEAGKIIRLKRQNAESVLRLEQSSKKLKVYTEAESVDFSVKDNRETESNDKFKDSTTVS